MSFQRIGKKGERVYGKSGGGVLFTDGHSILLLKRSDKGDNAGTWGIPGGKSRDGETLLGTAQRETKEEIGCFPNCSRVDSVEFQNGKHRFKTFIVRVKDPFPCELSDEHDEWDWVGINELKRFKLHPKFQEGLPTILGIIEKKFPTSLPIKNEMSMFAEFMGSVSAIGIKKGKKDQYQVQGDPSSMIKPKRKKKS